MELHLHKGFLVLLLLPLCQGQDPVSLSPTPSSAVLDLVDVIDAVKAAFLQVVHNLAPQGNREPDHAPFDKVHATENPSGLVVLERVVENARDLEKVTLNSSNQDVGSVQEPKKLSLVEEEEPDLEETQEALELDQDPVKPIHENLAVNPNTAQEDGPKDKQDRSLVHLKPLFKSESETGTLPLQEHSVEFTRSHKEPGGPDVDVVGKSEEEDGENTVAWVDQFGRGPNNDEAPQVASAFAQGSQEQDVTQETNSEDNLESSWNPESPTFGVEVNFQAFPSRMGELGEAGEPVEEPAEPTSPKQEAWKIGVLVVAFFLVLQSLVTAIYILKCKQKCSSGMDPERVCKAGIRGDQYDADTTISADDRSAVEGLAVQQGATLPMTAIHSDSAAQRL